MTDSTKRRKRPRLGGVDPKIAGAIADAISSGTGGDYRYADVPLNILRPDPDNPRRLHVGREDLAVLPQGSDAQISVDRVLTNPSDNAQVLHEQKREVTDLIELALTIRAHGLISPIVVYESGANYQVIVGERRTLACHMAGLESVAAKIYSERPQPHILRAVQLIENVNRSALPLADRLHNLELIAEGWRDRYGRSMQVTDVAELIGCSSAMAWVNHRLVNAPKDVREAIRDGKITSINRFRIICNEESEAVRTAMIADPRPIEELRRASSLTSPEPKRGRKKRSLRLVVKNHGAARRIIEALSQLDPEGAWEPDDFDDFNQMEEVAAAMIKRIEAHYG